MKVPQTVAEVLQKHRGHRFASSAVMKPRSDDFVGRMEQYAPEHQVPVVPFDRDPYKGRKKDDLAQEYLARQQEREGVMFLGKAPEKTHVCRPERRRSPDGQSTYPWIVKSTGMVNHYYGLLRCRDPRRAQALADSLSAAKIDALVRKWFKALPHPFPAADRRAGYRYEPFIWQSEFSLAQVLDRPLSGRVFFEEVIRENLDLGRPEQSGLRPGGGGV